MATISLPDSTTVSGQCPTYPDNAVVITPSDANFFSTPVIVQVGGAGTIAFVPWSAQTAGTIVTTSLPAGGTLGVRVAAVKATGTTATGVIGIY